MLRYDYRPFAMTGPDEHFEGISADYLDIVAKTLQKPVELRVFDDKQSALAALRAGELDLVNLGNLSLSGPDQAGIALSQRYFSSAPVFSALAAEQGPLLLPGQRVATVQGYVDEAAFKRYYPDLVLVNYPSNVAAFDAVFFGREPLLLSDPHSLHYLNSERFDKIRQRSQAQPAIAADGFRFAVSADSPRLLALLNHALAGVSDITHSLIFSQWNGPIRDIVERPSELYSAEERAWLATAGPVRVWLMDDLYPTGCATTTTSSPACRWRCWRRSAGAPACASSSSVMARSWRATRPCSGASWISSAPSPARWPRATGCAPPCPMPPTTSMCWWPARGMP